MPGLVVVAGGKYTTYRVMAKDAVDAAVHGLDRRVPPSVHRQACRCSAPRATPRCGTPRALLAEQSGLHVARIEHLLSRYGSLIDEVLDLVADGPGLGEPLDRAPRTTCAPRSSTPPSHEGARHLDDVLTRRTRISIETFDRGVGSARGGRRADGAGARAGAEEQIDREVEHYRKRVEAERESQQKPDDQTADAARLGAPDVVPVR